MKGWIMPLVIVELCVAFLAPRPFQLVAIPIGAIAMIGLVLSWKEEEK